MRKVKVFMVLSLLSILSLLLLTGCENGSSLHMDEDRCAEVALEYLEDKYQTEFEVLDSREIMKYVGSAGYAEVIVKNKLESEEKQYIVRVYPDGSSDDDKDNYYDDYSVISDTYMCYLLYDYVKNDLDKMLLDAGLTRFISSVSIREGGGIAGFLGFSADFPIPSEDSFSLEDIIDNYNVTIDCWLEIPESEYSEILQTNIIDIVKPLISDDLVTFSVEVYYDEHYKEIEEMDKNNIERNVIGDKSIYFSVKEEDENESK